MTIKEFAHKVEMAHKAQLMRLNLDCAANFKNSETDIHYGRKWIRVDVGYSGKYMIDAQGRIYGIKAYGVPNLGHYYGTLDNPTCINNTHWSHR